MRAYFSQFGEILRLRLSRNKRTGRSKHYAFIEFASAAVARIVAETMDKYLMFGHILQVRTIPKEQVHENLFKGANRRFKKVPWAKIEARKLRLGMEREGWEKRISKETGRRSKKLEKLKEAGFDYEFEAPALKSVKDVPVKPKPAAVEAGESEEVTKLLEAAKDREAEEPKTVVEKEVTVETAPGKVKVTEKVKVKKHKKAAAKDADVAAETPAAAEEPKEARSTRSQKADKESAKPVKEATKPAKAQKAKKA